MQRPSLLPASIRRTSHALAWMKYLYWIRTSSLLILSQASASCQPDLRERNEVTCAALFTDVSKDEEKCCWCPKESQTQLSPAHKQAYSFPDISQEFAFILRRSIAQPCQYRGQTDALLFVAQSLRSPPDLLRTIVDGAPGFRL